MASENDGAVGLINVREHCIFTWRERGSRRVVELRSHHCQPCIDEVTLVLRFGVIDLRRPGPESHSQTILVIDDDAAVRETFRDLLDDVGYLVYTAEDGADALRILSRIPRP